MTASQTAPSQPPSAASPPATITVDTQTPTVAVNEAATQADPTNAEPVHFTAVFSEPVYDFNGGGVVLGGTGGS